MKDRKGGVGDMAHPNYRYLNSGFTYIKSLFYIFLNTQRSVCIVTVIHEFDNGSTLTSINSELFPLLGQGHSFY